MQKDYGWVRNHLKERPLKQMGIDWREITWRTRGQLFCSLVIGTERGALVESAGDTNFAVTLI